MMRPCPECAAPLIRIALGETGQARPDTIAVEIAAGLFVVVAYVLGGWQFVVVAVVLSAVVGWYAVYRKACRFQCTRCRKIFSYEAIES